jgi:hypothetical protein
MFPEYWQQPLKHNISFTTWSDRVFDKLDMLCAQRHSSDSLYSLTE